MLLFKNFCYRLPSEPCCGNLDMPDFQDLDQMVAHYRTERRQIMLRLLDELFSVGDCVFGAHNQAYTMTVAQANSEVLQLHPHFNRIIKTSNKIDPTKRGALCKTLDEIRRTLEAYDNVNDYFGREWKSFEEFHDTIHGAFRPMQNIGELSIYDISLRLAWHYSFDGLYTQAIVPSAWVYLHAGANDGAENLLGKGFVNPYKDPTAPRGVVRVPRFIFPVPLQSLPSFEIEDFLCIYKQPLKKFGPYLVPQLTQGQVFGHL